MVAMLAGHDFDEKYNMSKKNIWKLVSQSIRSLHHIVEKCKPWTGEELEKMSLDMSTLT